MRVNSFLDKSRVTDCFSSFIPLLSSFLSTFEPEWNEARVTRKNKYKVGSSPYVNSGKLKNGNVMAEMTLP